MKLKQHSLYLCLSAISKVKFYLIKFVDMIDLQGNKKKLSFFTFKISVSKSYLFLNSHIIGSTKQRSHKFKLISLIDTWELSVTKSFTSMRVLSKKRWSLKETRLDPPGADGIIEWKQKQTCDHFVMIILNFVK